jgi:hypothetical protein
MKKIIIVKQSNCVTSKLGFSIGFDWFTGYWPSVTSFESTESVLKLFDEYTTFRNIEGIHNVTSNKYMFFQLYPCINYFFYTRLPYWKICYIKLRS